MYYDLDATFSYQSKCFVVSFSVVSAEFPVEYAKDGVYSLLGSFNEAGIDMFYININSQSFLTPKPEFGHGTGGLRVGSDGFDTDIDISSFEERYLKLCKMIYYYKQKFDGIIYELAQLGYINAYFFIPSRYVEGKTLEVVLYCEYYINLSDEPASAMLDDMDDNYLRIGDNEIIYTLEHIYR